MGKLNKFTKKEFLNVSSILFVLSLVIFINLQISLRKGRDSTRKDDISAIQKGLESYYSKYKIYPLSTSDGKIIGCFDERDVLLDETTGKPINAQVCEWGESSFENMPILVRDPNFLKNGANYNYISLDENSYEVYISLEGKDEDEYTESVVNQNLKCGSQICNYGRVVKLNQ